MKRLLMLLAWASAFVGCGFHDVVDHGVPNLAKVEPRDTTSPPIWRSGQPADAQAWRYLFDKLGSNVTVIKLDDEIEGNDDLATEMGWKVIKFPMPPEDDKPWSIFVKPDPRLVRQSLATIIIERAAGRTILIHCVHGRDRTSLLSAIVGMSIYRWSQSYAWHDMIVHGFRWELPDLDAYWLVDVP